MQFNRRLNPVGHCHNQNFEQEKTEEKESQTTGEEVAGKEKRQNHGGPES